MMTNMIDEVCGCFCRLCDWLVTWWGEKVAERQGLCEELQSKDSLYTPYARDMIGKQEVFAREGDMDARPQGNNTYLVTETFLDKDAVNRRNGRDGPLTTIERNTVDLVNKTCTCQFPKDHKLPCKHVILACDERNQERKTEIGQKQFRKDWVDPYFWAENYVEAYKKVTVRAPCTNNEIYVNVPEGRCR